MITDHLGGGAFLPQFGQDEDLWIVVPVQLDIHKSGLHLILGRGHLLAVHAASPLPGWPRGLKSPSVVREATYRLHAGIPERISGFRL